MEWFDWLVLGATTLLALLTIWEGSSIVRGMWDYLFVSIFWAVVGVAWCAATLVRTTDRAARAAMWILLVGSVVSILALGPVTALVFSSPSDRVGIAVLVIAILGLFLVRQRPIRLVWFVAPAIVVAASGLVLSGVPNSVRFAAAEAELTRYVQGLDAGMTPIYFDDPISVGEVPVYEVLPEEGQVRLVTGYIGILADDPAGLAYVPEGTPVGVGWEHIRGPWYSWIPLAYVDDGTD